jgi:hypothetical protein
MSRPALRRPDSGCQEQVGESIPIQFHEITRLQRANCGGNLPCMKANRRPVVCWKNEDGELLPGEILLAFKVLIAGDKRCKPSFDDLKQSTVLQLSPAHFLRGVDLGAGEKMAQRTWNAGIQLHSHAGCSAAWRAYSKTATACSRVTSGKQSRYSSRLRPLSRFWNKLSTGTRVPWKHGVPPNRSRSTQMGTSAGK